MNDQIGSIIEIIWSLLFFVALEGPACEKSYNNFQALDY